MAELSTLSRPYSKAVFKSALESNSLAQWSEALDALTVVLSAENAFQLVSNPSLTVSEKASVFIEVAGEACHDSAKKLVQLLAENNRLALIPEIKKQFDHLKAEHELTAEVTITSAFELSEAQLQKLTVKLSKRLARDVKISVLVDPSLIGGVKIQAGDLVIDDSVSGKLSKLADVIYS